MKNNNHVKQYYNDFKTKLISDFFRPNIRIERAIIKALSKIPIQSKKILDLGFGLGWSSYEIAKHFTNSTVDAYDISDELTKTAKSLFKLDNLSYLNMDLTETFPVGTYDIIILLDVFEHIPKTERDHFYKQIDAVLSETGKIIMTCPTIYHQEYLRKNNPAGLQPVDEDIELNVIEEFAKNTNTQIAHFEYLDIWNSRDYQFIIIEKAYKYHSKQKFAFLEELNLLSFHEKYSLILKSGLRKDLIPTLSRRQKIIYKIKTLIF
ncbi:MAG: 2-polyprenyl-3-methyl-5-hydroxy-6-metoxy-1,4-benzoquinol methylase [Psychroserpens sp.]|jgi:2-polyprenyl-3-methyl-5-hydroxy-6-metoxy-1,4-benzoquinol methylase